MIKSLLFCRKNYKGYLLESRLHFRIHAVRLQLSGPVNDGVGSIDQDLDSDPRTVGEESNSTSIPKDDSTSSLSTNLQSTFCSFTIRACVKYPKWLTQSLYTMKHFPGRCFAVLMKSSCSIKGIVVKGGGFQIQISFSIWTVKQ